MSVTDPPVLAQPVAGLTIRSRRPAKMWARIWARMRVNMSVTDPPVLAQPVAGHSVTGAAPVTLPGSLPQELLDLGSRPLYVMCDYDGTLAPITLRPGEALPQPGAREALSRLLHHPGRQVTLVTGRRIGQVQAFLGLPGLEVVGLHGMEWPENPPAPADRVALSKLARQLPTLHGFRLEDKHYTLAAHYRGVDPSLHPGLEARLDAVALPSGWEVVQGKQVREYRPGGFGKGRAAALLARAQPDFLPVFIGDDATDEEGFRAVLELGGVAVKVGEGATLAQQRLADPAEVVALLNSWSQLV